MTAKILVVDDEPHFELIIKKSFRRQIRRQEYEFLFALNGVEALVHLGEHRDISLVLTDINMPEMNGLTLLKHINEDYPLIKTVVITAYGDMSNIRQTMNGGAFDFLIKPIDLDDLRKTLEKTLSYVAKLQELERVKKEKEEASRALVENLRKMDEMKDEFLANVTHELNTPLHGIIGIAESMAEGASGSLGEEAEQNLGMIVSSGRRLCALVQDLLDFAKMKNSEIVLHRRPLDLAAIARVVLTLSRPLLAGRALTLVSEIPANIPLVMADENRIQQILHNLIGNAIKFTEKGRVTLSTRTVDNMIAVTVSDTGIGIPPDQFEEIFNSFSQLDGTTTRAYGGTGLGLSITRKLVQLHGGTISVDSKLGEGSGFTFTLPVSERTRKVPAEPEYDQPTVISWNSESEMDAGTFMPHLDNDDGGDFRILVADDEPINLRILTNQFSLLNYEVVPVSNGSRAVEILREDTHFDLLLLDLMMPGLSGFEVCHEIRKRYSLFELPILILTAKNQPRDFLAGLEAGANDYLPKPFDRRELLARVRTLLTLKRAVEHAIMHTRHLEAERQKRGLADNLRNLMVSLTSTLELEQVFNRFLENLQPVTPFNQALILLLHDHNLSLSVTRGYDREPSFENHRDFYERIFDDLTHGRQPIRIDTDSAPEKYLGAGMPRGIGEFLCVPFFIQSEVCGMVVLQRHSHEPFTDQEMQLSFAFAGQAAIAIENARLFEKVQNMAKTEELTGLYNRRHFFVLGRQEFQLAVDHGNALSAVMLDIDRFKNVNDSYGHSAGDEVLKAIAQRILDTCRKSDVVARYGGEEFAILLTNTDEKDAREVCERLRQRIQNETITIDSGNTVSVTASLGFVQRNDETEKLADLLRLADVALYEAKQQGRNRVIRYQPGQERNP